jgi:predicted RNA-binding protein YlqC (UPF0109 family)
MISSILGYKNDVNITLVENENELRVQINASSSSKSKLIGRDGKVINSMREYLRAISKKFNKRVYIEINEN